MLEIILVVYLSKKIGANAAAKGYKKAPHIILLVGLWIFFEIFGGFIAGYMQLESMGFAYLFALLGAALGAFLAFAYVNGLKPKTEESETLDQF